MLFASKFHIKGEGEDRNGTAEILLKGMKAMNMTDVECDVMLESASSEFQLYLDMKKLAVSTVMKFIFLARLL